MAKYIAFVYFTAMALALTFPGIAPFNTIRPFVLGVPFVFAWYVIWILGALLVLALLHRAYSK
jgi:hypothetical protein